MPEREGSKGSINFVHKKKGGILDRTVGRIRSLQGNIQLGIPLASFQDISEPTIADLKETFRDVDWRGNIEVQLNDSPFFEQIKRLFSKDRRTNLFMRALVGVPYTAYASLSGKTGRTDLYNGYTETAIIYSPNRYRAFQQLGKAWHYDHAHHSTSLTFLLSLPVFRSVREFWGSRHVMENLQTVEERQAARKILEPNFGVQAAQDAGFFTGLVKGVPFIPLFPAVGALIGHIHARKTDTNIFFDKNIRAHQTFAA